MEKTSGKLLNDYLEECWQALAERLKSELSQKQPGDSNKALELIEKVYQDDNLVKLSELLRIPISSNKIQAKEVIQSWASDRSPETLVQLINLSPVIVRDTAAEIKGEPERIKNWQKGQNFSWGRVVLALLLIPGLVMLGIGLVWTMPNAFGMVRQTQEVVMATTATFMTNTPALATKTFAPTNTNTPSPSPTYEPSPIPETPTAIPAVTINGMLDLGGNPSVAVPINLSFLLASLSPFNGNEEVTGELIFINPLTVSEVGTSLVETPISDPNAMKSSPTFLNLAGNQLVQVNLNVIDDPALEFEMLTGNITFPEEGLEVPVSLPIKGTLTLSDADPFNGSLMLTRTDGDKVQDIVYPVRLLCTGIDKVESSESIIIESGTAINCRFNLEDTKGEFQIKTIDILDPPQIDLAWNHYQYKNNTRATTIDKETNIIKEVIKGLAKGKEPGFYKFVSVFPIMDFDITIICRDACDKQFSFQIQIYKDSFPVSQPITISVNPELTQNPEIITSPTP